MNLSVKVYVGLLISTLSMSYTIPVSASAVEVPDNLVMDQGGASNTNQIYTSRNNINQYSGTNQFNRYRGSGPVANNDQIGVLEFRGAASNSALAQGALIEVTADGNPITNSVPSKISLGTALPGWSTAAASLILKNDAQLRLGY